MNPVAIKLGNFEIRWYAIFILIGAFIAIYLALKEAKRLNINKEFIFNMCFWAIIIGFIGARIYYVIFEWEYYSTHLSEIIQIWKGGLAIHGGIIAALITIWFYCFKYHARTIRYLDLLAPALVLAQAIGRWGNFFNSEAHGVATSLEKLQSLHIPSFIINGMYIDGVYYTPTFFYESLGCLLIFIIIIIIRRTRYRKVGSITGIYLIGYGILRFLIEISRTDALMVGGLKIAQLVSAIMIFIGVIILVKNGVKDRFEDLYNDSNNVDRLQF